MYEYLQGTLQSTGSDYVCLDVGGIGYKIHTSKTEKSRCLSLGKNLKLYVELIIREDAHSIYGFSEPRDRDLFRLLLHVNGIGPRVALNIIGSTCVSELRAALQQKNTKYLATIPGIGKKLAERLIVELNEKISSIDPGDSRHGNGYFPSHMEACRALETLGFSLEDARAAVAHVQRSTPEAITIEDIIQQVLSFKKNNSL